MALVTFSTDSRAISKPLYRESKRLLEKKLEELRLSQNFGYCILRYFNVAGASPDSLITEVHNPETHLVPNILLSLLGEKKEFKVFGNNYTACEKVTGQKIPYKIVEPRPGDPPILVASSAKIRAELGWSPKYPDLESIIGHAWKWHKKQTSQT